MKMQHFTSYQDLITRLEADLPSLTRSEQLRTLRWVTGQVAVQAGINVGASFDFKRYGPAPAGAVVRTAEPKNAANLLARVLKGAAIVGSLGPKLLRLETVLKNDDPDQIFSLLKDITRELPPPGRLLITA